MKEQSSERGIAALAVIEVLSQQRMEKRLENLNTLARVLQAVEKVCEQALTLPLEDHAQTHAVLKVALMRRMSDQQSRKVQLANAAQSALVK